jgi:TraH_2
MDFDVNYIKQCVAPGVEPAAIEAIINETSGYNELAVTVVSQDGRKAVVVRQPTTVAAMTETVSSSVKTGADVRFGLGLIPARLLPELKVSVAQAAEPCTNLRIASLIYLRARQMVAATSRNPRDLARETRMAYLAGSHHGTPIEGLTPAGPVVVVKPPPRDFERGEAASAGSPGEPRRMAQASTPGGPAHSEPAAEGPPRPVRAADTPAREPTLFEVKSAPMTIDLSRFREAR